jgi:hypothetical protein
MRTERKAKVKLCVLTGGPDFSGSGRLGPLNSKTYVKASLAFGFCQHLCVLMADVKAALAFEILPTPTCF